MASGSAGFVAAIAGGQWGVLEGVCQGLEVGLLSDCTITVDFDKTELLLVAIAFLGVFVDEATRVDRGHLARVKGADLFEFTIGFGATVFGKAIYLISDGRLETLIRLTKSAQRNPGSR